ncbi:MAG TPA: hypothetical protein VKF80_01960 [Candidatus Eisenbacteria bacterium]|nr:hypothetical protein [Candidatus Eisenbacteria bacterium]
MSESPATPAGAFTALWLSLFLFAALLFGLRGYVTDDTFIHLQFAKHVRDGAGLVFNKDEAVPASTAPLWPLLLGLLGRGGADLLRLATALSALAGFLALAGFFRAARRLLLREEHAQAATIAWAANAWMARWTVSGMETALAVALVLWGWNLAWANGQPGGPGRRFRVGIVWGLATLARPEVGILVVLFAVTSFLWPDGAPTSAPLGARLRALLAVTGGAAVVLAPYALYAFSLYGRLLPSTFDAKGTGAHGAAVIVPILVLAAKNIGAVCAIETIACVLFAARFRHLLRHGDAALHMAIWSWIVLLPVGYAVRALPVLSRYLLPTLPFLVLYGWWALEHFRLSSQSPWRRTALAIALGLSVAINVAVYEVRVVPHTHEFAAGMERTLIPWGKRLAQTPPSTLVATPDIGAIGYYSDRRVLDLGGLVTPRIIPLMNQMDYDSLVRSFAFQIAGKPDYLVDRGQGPKRLLHESPFWPALDPIATARTQSLAIAKPGPVDYTLYKIDWSIADSVAAAMARTSR